MEKAKKIHDKALDLCLYLQKHNALLSDKNIEQQIDSLMDLAKSLRVDALDIYLNDEYSYDALMETAEKKIDSCEMSAIIYVTKQYITYN